MDAFLRRILGHDGKDHGCRIVRRRIKSGKGSTCQGSSTKDHFTFRSLLHNIEVTFSKGCSLGNLRSESPWERLAILMITLWLSHFGHHLKKSSSIAQALSTREVSRTAIFAFINWYNKTRRESDISRRFSSGNRLGFKPHS